ncbi:MAG: enoyl-CoA hydratase-related protein [Candidatus Promineifilaceae bacterium]
MNDEIEFRVEDGIGWLVVNRPMAWNALDWRAQERFAEVITAVSQNPSIRVLIIRGSGHKAFVAGGDLKELSQHLDPASGVRLNRVMTAALQQLTEVPVPVIAAINGDAYGGGCEIVTACDIRIAAAHARFCFAQVKQALTTGWGGAGRLVPLVGLGAALDLLLTARVFDAQEAKVLGLVQHVVAGEQLDTAVLKMAQHLAALPRQALAAAKELAYAASQQSRAETNQLERALFTHLWPQADHVEAVTAFLEKRPPNFE